MDTLMLTLKLAIALRDGDPTRISQLIAALEARLGPADLAVILEGLLGEDVPEPEPTPLPLASCA